MGGRGEHLNSGMFHRDFKLLEWIANECLLCGRTVLDVRARGNQALPRSRGQRTSRKSPNKIPSGSGSAVKSTEQDTGWREESEKATWS